MDDGAAADESVVFLVRMWRAKDSRVPWRGSIRSVTSGRTVYISGAHELGEFVTRMLQESERTL